MMSATKFRRLNGLGVIFLLVASVAVTGVNEVPEPAYSADLTPPAAIADLSVIQSSSTSITLTWTAPGNDGVDGTAASYDIRYYTKNLLADASSGSTWTAGTSVSNPPAPASAGSKQTKVVTNLTANTRYWFAIKTSDATNVSGISNSPANQITSLDQADVWLFNLPSYDSRSRNLLRIIQPDIAHRAAFDWVGTEFADRDFDGIKQSLSILTGDGTMLGGGISAYSWAPYKESLVPGLNRSVAIGAPSGFNADVYYLNQATADAANQLIYKLKKQVDAGFSDLELDELEDATQGPYIMNAVRAYAQNTYGRSVYISANSQYGGQDHNGTGSSNTGGESVDYYIRDYPFRLQGTGFDPYSHAPFDGTYNLIPNMRAAAANVAPKPFYYFVDFADETGYSAPHDSTVWPNFMRIANAQVIASGAFPGQGRSFYNTLDPIKLGVLSVEANNAKFLRENHELWHNLAWITPSTLSASASNVRTSAFRQTGRTILHLVNGNYDNATQTMQAQTALTTSISLATAPTNVWMTTPDDPSGTRRQVLPFTYSGGVATISVPKLYFHDVVVIEQGTTYSPIYNPMKVVFPFNEPSSIEIGNSHKYFAAQNEGNSQSMTWSVNGVPGGNSTVGTIDSGGTYVAPGSIPAGSTVTISATSVEVASASASVELKINNASTLPWVGDTNLATFNEAPANWEIVDGRGDWKVSTDGGTRVLHNFNLGDGAVTASSASYSPLIVSGQSTWSNYDFMYSVKPTKTPYHLYGIDSSKTDTFTGAVFRYQDSKNYYEYRIGYDDKVRLYRTVSGTTAEIGSGQSAGFPAIGNFSSVQIHASGPSFSISINGIVIRSDSDSFLTTGRVGFSSSLTETKLKDINVTGTAADPSVVDDLADWSKTYSHTANLGFDSTNSANLAGDVSRARRTNGSTGQEAIVWNQAGMTSFRAVGYFWEQESVSHYGFSTSTDGVTWTAVTPTITNGTSIWHQHLYALDNLSGTNFVRVQWNNATGQSWSPQLGQVTLTS